MAPPVRRATNVLADWHSTPPCLGVIHALRLLRQHEPRIRHRTRRRPVSWTNYIGVRRLCTVLSHNAGGYSFYKHAEHQRVTRFRPNGVPLDRPGHYVYLRDDETAILVDLLAARGQRLWPGPVRVPPRPLLLQVLLRLSRASRPSRPSSSPSGMTWSSGTSGSGTPATKPRRLSVFSYLEFSFHHIEIDNQNLQMSLYASGIELRRRHHRVRLLLRALDIPLLRRQLRARQLRLPCATVSSAATAPRPTRSRWSRASAAAARNWAATTAARCTSG